MVLTTGLLKIGGYLAVVHLGAFFFFFFFLQTLCNSSVKISGQLEYDQ